MAMIASRRGAVLPRTDLPPWTRECAIGWLLVLAPVGVLVAEIPFVPASLAFALADDWASLPFVMALVYALGVQLVVGDAARHAAARDRKQSGPLSYRVMMFAIAAVASGFATHRLLQCANAPSAVATIEPATLSAKWQTTGKGCHEHVRITGAPHWTQLDRCVSPARYQVLAQDVPVTLHLAIGPLGRAVTRVELADGSSL